MAWTVVGIFGGFGLGCLGLLTWVMSHLETNIGQRITEQGAVFGAAFDRFEHLVDTRFSEVYRRLDFIDRRFDRVDDRLDRVDDRLDRVDDRLGDLEEEVRGLRTELTEHVARHPG